MEMTSSVPILLVEDEKLLRSNVAYALSKDRGHKVHEAASAEDAMAVLEKNDISLVISDIRMEEMSGLELLSHVTDNYPNTGVIIMTAYASEAQRFEVLGRGGQYYLEKPFSLDNLVKTVDDVLEKMQSAGFTTTLESVTLIDLIQLYCLNRESGCIETSATNNNGRIFIDEGRFVHAEVGDVTGQEALIMMLGWEGGACSFERGITSDENTMPGIPADQALLDCLRIIDERKNDGGEKDSEDKPDQEAASLPPIKPVERDSGGIKMSSNDINTALSMLDTEGDQDSGAANMAKSILERLSGMTGLEDALILNESLDILSVSADCSGICKNLTTKILKSCLDMTNTLNRGNPDMVEIDMKNKKLNALRLKIGFLCCWTAQNIEVKHIMAHMKSNS